MLLDTGRAIVHLHAIIVHAACNAWGNAIITFFTPFDPAPCDKKSRSVHQTLFPLFGEGSGHETITVHAMNFKHSDIGEWLHYKNKLVVLTTEWLPWLQTNWRQSGC